MNEKELKKRNDELLRLLKCISVDYSFLATGRFPVGAESQKIAQRYIEKIKKLDAESEGLK